jgi:hypothetical protein
VTWPVSPFALDEDRWQKIGRFNEFLPWNRPAANSAAEAT